MRRARLKTWVCSLLAVTLLVATSQYLAHFHVLRASATAHVEPAPSDKVQGHASEEHCTLCLQFDRLPAPPSPQVAPAAYFFHVATVEAQRLERLALPDPQLWPPSRGPPALA